jgi:hypothetical protein
VSRRFNLHAPPRPPLPKTWQLFHLTSPQRGHASCHKAYLRPLACPWLCLCVVDRVELTVLRGDFGGC